MQIQAFNYSCQKPHFLGVQPKKQSSKEPKELSNEEVLALAKTRMAKRKPVFTPSQKEILPIVDDFNASGILDYMKNCLEDADEIVDELKKSGNKSAHFEEDGKHYCYKKTKIPEMNGYDVTLSVATTDGHKLYKYTSNVRGGYSKDTVSAETDDFGKVSIERQGRYGSSRFSVNNLEQEKYYFSGDINEDGEGVVNNIINFE